MQQYVKTLTLFLGVAISLPLHAALITVQPQRTLVTEGDQLVVDLAVSDLGELAPASISTFDIDLGFDDSILGFSKASFGSQLDLFAIGSLQTLADRPNSKVRDELMDFYDRHYSANLMTLVVLGKEPLFS